MEEINQELGFSPPLPQPQEQDPLPSVGPLLCQMLPPPGPDVGELWRLAWKGIALWIGPECI